MEIMNLIIVDGLLIRNKLKTLLEIILLHIMAKQNV
jgi:hypothetical protein